MLLLSAPGRTLAFMPALRGPLAAAPWLIFLPARMLFAAVSCPTEDCEEPER